MKIFKANIILFKFLGYNTNKSDSKLLKIYGAFVMFCIVNMTFPEIIFIIYTNDVKEITSCLTTLALMVITTFKAIVTKGFFSRLLDLIAKLQENFNKSENSFNGFFFK